MTDDKKAKLARGLRRELTEAQCLEQDLDRLFGALQPPYGAQDRLQAILDPAQAFSEQDLVLDGGLPDGPYSFEDALAQQEAANDSETGSDLLAAGLEEEPIEEKIDEPVQPEHTDDNKG